MKITFVTLLASLFVVSAQAASKNQVVTTAPKSQAIASETQVHFHLGPNISNANPSRANGEIPSYDSQSRLLIGAGIEQDLMPSFAVLTELNYVQRGYEHRPNANTLDTYSLNYLEVPVLAKAKYTLDSGFTPSFAMGPYLSVLVGSSKNRNQMGKEFARNDDVNGAYKTLGWGLVFAPGASYPVYPGIEVNGQLRYAVGLSDIASKKEGIDSLSFSSVQLLIGASIGI